MRNVPYVCHRDANGTILNPINGGYLNPFPNRQQRRQATKLETIEKILAKITSKEMKLKEDLENGEISKNSFLYAIHKFAPLKNKLINILKNGGKFPNGQVLKFT